MVLTEAAYGGGVRKAPGAVIVGVGLLWALLVLVGPPAHAHTTLVSSSPADGAQLDTPPAAIELVFSEPVDARFVTVVVSSADGGHWEDGAPMVSETVVVQPVHRLTVPAPTQLRTESWRPTAIR